MHNFFKLEVASLKEISTIGLGGTWLASFLCTDVLNASETGFPSG